MKVFVRKILSIRYFKLMVLALTSRERKFFVSALILLCISLGVIMGRFYYRATILIPVAGGEYREGIVGQPISINPILNQSNDVDRDIVELVFSGLFKSNGHGGVRPDLAESYAVSDGSKVWTVYLRDNVYWHDGERFTADDVLFTVEAIQDAETGSRLFTSWQGVVVEQISAREVRFSLRAPYAPFMENLKDLKILPRHLYQSIPHANFRTSDYNVEPVGTGPFQFSSVQKRKDGFVQSYTFVRNEKYYSGPVFIERLMVRFYQDNDELAQAFNRREIDGFGNASKEVLAKIKIPAQTFVFSMPRYYALFFNQNIAESLSDPKIRKSFTQAIDSKSMIEIIFGGSGSIAHGPIVSGMLGYENSEPLYPYDPIRAALALDEAGWKLSEGERVRKKGEVPLLFELMLPDTVQLRQAAEMIARDFERVGVGISVVVVPVSEITDEVMRGRTYQMLLFGNIVNFESDLFSFWHSSQRLYPGLNLSLFSDKEVDALIESSRQSLDRAKRAADIAKAARIIEEKTPAVFLFSPDYIYVMNNKVRDIQANRFILTSAERLSQIERWSIRQVRVFK